MNDPIHERAADRIAATIQREHRRVDSVTAGIASQLLAEVWQTFARYGVTAEDLAWSSSMASVVLDGLRSAERRAETDEDGEPVLPAPATLPVFPATDVDLDQADPAEEPGLLQPGDQGDLADRAPTAGEQCTCGRPAIRVYRFQEPGGGIREVSYCGIPDGGDVA